jgi:uncharacterized protein (DUF3084 family)
MQTKSASGHQPQKEKPKVTAKEQLQQITDELQKLTGVVSSLAASVVHRDNQIDAHTTQIDGLIKVTSETRLTTVELRQTVEALSREWQAYLRTIRPQ